MEEIIHELLSEEVVAAKIEEIAQQIDRDYAGKTVHMICILKGSIFFFSELAKRIKLPVTMDFMSASSYGNGTESSGHLEIKKDLDEPVDGRDIIVVEDIIDSGHTLSLIKKIILARNPASLKLCTLLDKPDRREADIEPDYTGFVIPDEFVVGYGLDYAQRYRNLPYIGVLEFK
ncbi:MAG: hypoxanthine phosphoribosyltransferase [Lachnospiraceae bacterium]|nr:hypoxanthine phosphoribosyltransferase [Lachnospiraceae bacterium]